MIQRQHTYTSLPTEQGKRHDIVCPVIIHHSASDLQKGCTFGAIIKRAGRLVFSIAVFGPQGVKTTFFLTEPEYKF